MEKQQTLTSHERMGERIEFVRELRQKKQAEVAEAIGMDQPRYSKAEKGKVRFTPEQLGKLGEILNWPVEDFMSTGPIVVHVENNHGGNNGYNVTENLQQHSVPADLVERMLQKNEDRWEMMMKHMMEFMERMIKK